MLWLRIGKVEGLHTLNIVKYILEFLFLLIYVRGMLRILWVRGWRSPNSDDWRKGLALCLLCDINCR
jgi:hypothetical protein